MADKAKILDAVGEKYQERQEFVGKTIRTHNFEIALNHMLGNKDFAKYKVMMFLSGNMAWRDRKQGTKPFKVVKKTVCARCNITERSYKDIMQDLEARGWIDRTDDFCVVRYDNFFAEWDEYLAKEMNSDFAGEEEMSSFSEDTNGLTEMSSKKLGNEFLKFQEVNSEILGNECTRNNISNNIKEQNNEDNITDRCSRGGDDKPKAASTFVF